MALLLEAVEPPALELLPDEVVLRRSENRLELPLVAPRLVAADAEPSADEEVLLAVFEEATAVLEAATVAVEETLEAFELELLEPTRLPLELLRLPCNCGAMSAAKRSAWIVPPRRTVRFSSPNEMTAVRIAATDGPPPPFSGGTRLWFQ
jgi:hypothetical protein